MTDTRNYHLEWVEDLESLAPKLERRAITRTQELDEWLDRLSRQAQATEPFIVELIEPQHGALGMGLGGSSSVLAFNGASGLPPYYLSAGEDEFPADTPASTVAYYYQGEWTEFSKASLVPIEAARQAMRIFLESGRRPDNIRWDEV